MDYSTSRAGQQLGNYRILQLIGQGGFADVYLGEHIHLNTLAAIKVLRTRLVEDNVDNFRSEARTVAHLLHPNIVRVLDFGVENTVPFLVMEYAPNGTLRQRHPRGTTVPIEVVLPYVKQVAAALQYAHDQKIIHRDIKPENVLIGRNDEVLLSDFGIAVVTQSMRVQMSNAGTSDTAGTASYMAPEQIMGDAVPASDQYALAIMIYEWLTGIVPFKGTYLEVVAQHMQQTPPSLRGKAPQISPDVEQVIMVALNKDPAKRFARIESFARALEQAAQSNRSQPLSKPSETLSALDNKEESAMEAALKGPFGRRSLGPNSLTIGRAPDNGLVISDMKASSHHAEMHMEGQYYAIVDLGSTNGTFVNDQRLPARSSRLLQPGDAIRIGDTVLLFEASAPLQSGSYTFAGPTVRDPGPALGVSTNFGGNYGAMQPGFGEVAAQNVAPAPSQYAPTPAPSPFMPPQYASSPTPAPASFTPPPYAPTPTPNPASFTPPPPQYMPPAPQYNPQAQYTPSSPQYGGQPSQYTEPQPPVLMPPSPPSQPGVQRASSSRMRSILLALIAFIVIVAAASSFFVIHNNQVAQQQAATATANANATTFARDTATANANATGTAIANATGTAIANANATATALATSHFPPFTNVALNDALTSNSGSNWNQGTACQFTSAGYQTSIAQAGFFEKCFAGSTDFNNFAFQVTMTITKGDCGGLMFRAVDNQNFYAFYVCANGAFNAVLYVKGADAGSTKVATSSAIHSGLNQSNTLAVVVQGNTYNLYANGQNIDSFTDSTFTHGSIGVMAVDISSPTVVVYANALVWTGS